MSRWPISALLPASREARAEHPVFYRLVWTIRPRITLDGIRPAFYATSDTLLPFVVLLLIRTRYNLGTVLGMRWEDVTDRGDRFVLSPYKPKAQRGQTRSEPAGDSGDPLSLRSMLRVLRETTARVRRDAPDLLSDLVFLPASQRAGGRAGMRISTMDQAFTKGGNTASALDRFLERHRLDRFTAKAIRATLLNALANGYGGLTEAQREGNHSELITTLRHYISIETFEQRRLVLATIPGQLARWSATAGSIDPRHLPSTADLNAATPGFGCLSPYESPIEGQDLGRLCRAEGHCARCPLAYLRADDPRLVAYVLTYAEAAARADQLAPEVAAALLEGYARFLGAVPAVVLKRAMTLPKPVAQIPN